MEKTAYNEIKVRVCNYAWSITHFFGKQRTKNGFMLFQINKLSYTLTAYNMHILFELVEISQLLRFFSDLNLIPSYITQ